MSIVPEVVGWLATAVFTLSYFCKDAGRLRVVQAVGALVWISYGLLIRSFPVIVANVLVAGSALYSWRASISAK